MFKKAFQIAVTFSLLVGGYTGYTRVFAIVATVLGGHRDGEENPFPEIEPKSARTANELARSSFGPNYWAAQKTLKLQYYDKARGYYMYAQNYERLNGGKTLHIWPFALVWISEDGKSRKTATSDEAVIDMSQRMELINKPSSEPNQINHAKLMGNVQLRDDKGSLTDLTDDLRIGPLTHLEYDEPTLQITSDSDIFLQDRDTTVTGIGTMIQLRRKRSPAGAQGGGGMGFDAESIFVYKDVHVMVNNVTSNGVLPGTAKPEKSGKTPLDVRSDREMKVVLPHPNPDFVGPPDPNQEPDPTLVFFKTNVRVFRGTDQADRLNCDTLDLILMPAAKSPVLDGEPKSEGQESVEILASTPLPSSTDGSKSAEATPATAPSGGIGTDLKLRRALARGDAVWLQSDAQGMVARCVELVYEKHAVEGVPDKTYLNGGPAKKLWVEKVEYNTKSANPATVKSIMRLTALDATIFDSGKTGSSKILARGPGKTEERPARNASVARTAWFEDDMTLLSWRDGEMATPAMSPIELQAFKFAPPAPASGTLRRLLTLTGVSKLIDHTSASTLDARKSIVAEFQASPKVGANGADGPNQIKWMDAYEDAHVTVPSRTLTAHEFLKVKFENPPAPPVAPTPSAVPTVGNPTIVAAAPVPVPPADEEKPEPKVARVEPAVDGRAKRVWATVLLGSAGKSKGELKDAQLRGSVMVHQDPSPGKPQGADASGEALDLTGQGLGLMKFIVKAVEPPQASDAKTRLASGLKTKPAIAAAMAKVEFEGKVIESVDLIALDQKADFAYSNGAGIFTQLADRGLLDDKGVEGDTIRVVAKPTGPNPKDKLAITWTDEMRFYGKSRDLEGRPAAKVEFRGVTREVRSPNGQRETRRGVEAKMTDSAIYCDTMDVYMDRTMDFVKTEKKALANPDEPAPPDPQIAMLDCRGQNVIVDGLLKTPGVDITSQKLFPESRELKEKQRIQGIHVIYDKRTGNFYERGPGIVWLYKRKGDAKPGADKPSVIPIAAPSAGRSRLDAPQASKNLPPLELTKVKFSEGMIGRFGVAKDQTENETREAEFMGIAQAVNAIVPHKNADIDFDQLERWRDFTFLSSDSIRVFSFPPAIGSKATARQLLNARGNSAARTIDSLIQADRITFDSGQDLIYAYGDAGKEVSLTKQESLGQPANTARGKSLRFNNKTHESELNDPHALQFTDLKSGLRPKPFFPDLGGTPKPLDPIKMPRLGPQKQGRSSTERKTFSGGQ